MVLKVRLFDWHGRMENPGWKLNKPKFLPMVNWSFSEFPDKNLSTIVDPNPVLLIMSEYMYVGVLPVISWTRTWKSLRTKATQLLVDVIQQSVRCLKFHIRRPTFPCQVTGRSPPVESKVE